MKDYGLIFIILLGLLGGIQFLANFIIDPLIKKKKNLEYHFNVFLVMFTVFYLIGTVVVLILALCGFFEYY